jgi:hypothetical protein
MRSARIVVLGAAVLAVVAVAAVALLTHTSQAFTLGVVRAAPAVTLEPGQQACQRPIDVPGGGSFDRVGLSVGTFQRAGSPLAITVADLGGRALARGTLAGGYPDIAGVPVHRVPLDRTVGEGRVAVCVTNRGPRKVALYGNADAAARSSSAYKDGRPAKVDLSLEFERASRSWASELPRMLDRAALFRAPWLGPWVYWILAAALLVGAPWLVLRAVRAAAGDGPPAAGHRGPSAPGHAGPSAPGHPR